MPASTKQENMTVYNCPERVLKWGGAVLGCFPKMPRGNHRERTPILKHTHHPQPALDNTCLGSLLSPCLQSPD